MVISIVIRCSFEGVHSWPGAPSHLRENYLSYPHRHRFHVEATKTVTHTERDVEFIQFQREVETYCAHRYAGPHTFSCESMAVDLVERFGLSRCRVMEDAENGAEVEA